MNTDNAKRIPYSSFLSATIGLALAAAATLTGCVTTVGNGGEALHQASHPAWSLKLSPPHLVVAVSPVRQTLQIAGSMATVLGAGITAVQNAVYKGQIQDALGDYDTARILEARAGETLAAALDGKGTRVEPFDAHVEGMTVREAAQARWRKLAKAGYDAALDVIATHGIYDVGGELVVRLHAELHAVPSGKLLWKDTLTFRGGDALAFRSLKDPTQHFLPNFLSPRLTAKEGAVSQWTDDHGARLKKAFEQAMTASLAGLRMSLGGEETADGLFGQGNSLMYRKDFAEAGARLEKARRLAPERLDIASTEAVNLGMNRQTDDAIALSEKLLAADPNNAAAHMNIAWWYWKEKNQPGVARNHYEAARRLGMAPVKKLEKALAVPSAK